MGIDISKQDVMIEDDLYIRVNEGDIRFFYTARSAGQKGCVNMPLLGDSSQGRLGDQSEWSR